MASLRLTVQTVGGVVSWGRGQYHRINRTRLAVLVMYLVVNLGLPIGDFTPKAGAAPVAKECRCSPASRAAGRCCCRKGMGSAGSAKTGCCATTAKLESAKPESKGCCAKKSVDRKPRVQAPVNEDVLAWTSDCPCGPIDTPMLLICPQPRILQEISILKGQAAGRGRLLTAAQNTSGTRSRPSVPPPEIVA